MSITINVDLDSGQPTESFGTFFRRMVWRSLKSEFRRFVCVTLQHLLYGPGLTEEERRELEAKEGTCSER